MFSCLPLSEAHLLKHVNCSPTICFLTWFLHVLNWWTLSMLLWLTIAYVNSQEVTEGSACPKPSRDGSCGQTRRRIQISCILLFISVCMGCNSSSFNLESLFSVVCLMHFNGTVIVAPPSSMGCLGYVMDANYKIEPYDAKYIPWMNTLSTTWDEMHESLSSLAYISVLG